MAENSLTIRLGMTGAASVLGGLGSVQARVSAMSSAITSSTSKIAAGLAAITGGAGIAASFGAVIKNGFEFNSTLQDTQRVIAVVQKGVDPERFKSFGDAMSVAGQSLNSLEEAAASGKPSFEQLLGVFSEMTGVATSAGLSLNEQISIATKAGNVMSEVGFKSSEFAANIISLFPTGESARPSPLTKLLSIDPSTLVDARKAGTLAVTLEKSLASMSESAKSSELTFTALWDNVKSGLRQASGEASKPIFEAVESGLKRINSFNWKELGQNAGGFVSAFMDSWKEGRIDEFISLTLEAGFEKGKEFATSLFSGSNGFVSSASVGLISSRIAEAILLGASKGVFSFSTFVLAGFGFVGKEIAKLFAGIWNKIVGAAADTINFFMKGIDGALSAVGLNPTGLTSNPEPISVSWDFNFSDALERADETLGPLQDKIDGSVKNLMDSYRSFITDGEVIGGQNDKAVSAWERLNKLITTANEKRGVGFPRPGDAAFIGPLAGVNSPLDVKPPQQFHFNLLKAEFDLKREIAALDEAQFNVQNNWALTSAEKRREGIKLLNIENEILKANIEFLTVNLAKTTDQKGRDEITGAIEGLQGKLGQNRRQRVSLGPDPDNFADTWISEFKRVQDSIGTMSQQIARTVSGTIGASLQTVSGYMNKMIWQGGSLKEMWIQVQQVISGKVLDAIADMFQEWISGILARSAVEKTAAIGDAAAKAPSAMLTSILSYGTAALVGAAAMAAAMGAFQGGGYTGDGPSSQIAGYVHKGELVIPAPVTSRLDQSERAAMLRGNLPSRQQSGGGSTSIRNDNRMVVAGVFDSEMAATNALKSRDGQSALMNFNQRNGFRFNRS